MQAAERFFRSAESAMDMLNFFRQLVAHHITMCVVYIGDPAR
jgi:hypothetical protein